MVVSCFNGGGGGCFSDGGGASFLSEGCPIGGHWFWWEGGGFQKKIIRWGSAPSPPLRETLIPGGNFGT